MKKLLLKIKLFFATIFGNLDKFITDNVDEAISVVNAIKGIVNSPIIGAVVKLTPTGIDDKYLPIVKNYLDKAIEKLGIAKECQSMLTEEQRLTCYLKYVKSLSPAMQQAVYMKTASLYAEAKSTRNGIVTSTNKPQISDIDTLVQLRYKDIKL